jgi:Outer membrane protein beta-barrel domain
MKKFFVFALVLLTAAAAFAQKDSTTQTSKKKDWSKVKLGHRANDHFMFQLGYDNWAGRPDTIQTTGLSRSVNVYFMLDFPFKSDPRFSAAAGLGIGSSNIYFNQQEVLVASTNSTLSFPTFAGGNHFKKFKLVSTYLDIPIELRFALDPENTNKSWKFAIGAKVGILLSTYTKGKDMENNANQSLNNYIEKESSKKYFNGTRLSPTARISYGVFGIFAQYQVTSFIKTTYGPPVYPFAFGITLSGL